MRRFARLFPLLLALGLLLVACAPSGSATQPSGTAMPMNDSNSNMPMNDSSPNTGAAPSNANVVKTEKGQYTNVTPTELQSMLKNKDFLFVNVHIPFEGSIPQTDLSIPYDQIGQQVNQLPADKNARIVLYCRSGRMSDIAARTLIDAGYTNLYNLQGGFDAWKAAGLPLETTQK